MDGGTQNIDNVTPTSKQEVATPEALKSPVAQTGAPSDQTLLAFTGQSFDYQEKGIWWYVAAGVVVLGIIGYLAWQKDWFSIVITVIIAAVLTWYVASVRPREVNYELTDFGVKTNDQFYHFNEIHSFWIIYHDKVKTLNLMLIKKYLPTVTIDITNADPNQVRTILARKIPEETGRTENILDRMVRTLHL